MWSVRTIRSPGLNESRTPPAALVRTTRRRRGAPACGPGRRPPHRAAFVVVDPPESTATGVLPTVPRTSSPACPTMPLGTGKVRDRVVRDRRPVGELLRERRRVPTRARARPAASSSPCAGPRRRPRPGGRSAPRRSLARNPRQLPDQSRDRRGHEADERPGEQRPEPQPREVGLARRREAADAADLDADRGKVREPAEANVAISFPSPRAARRRPSSSRRRRTR
jgi:hypothetical protein